MTDKEKAEEHALLYCVRNCTGNKCATRKTCERYKARYSSFLSGLAEGRKLGKEEQWKATEKAQKKTSARIRELEKENAELKEHVSRTGYRIAELKHEIDELIEKLKGFESGDVAWQGDMDETIKQNLELKEQNKIILEDNDTLNKWVDELKAQIEKTKNCVNCKHKNIYQYDFINECRLTENQINYEHKCDKWELAE